ncbi:hypothetical protein EGR_07974 [Echinococcus granulosus]|uniref:Uncharacterized protein n=1 Tax=Echinococcus granulosus TaxID=6210 RepID=W6UG84_ECHGR|nr:hypothetical protein EGR_07974 [Echinococcus granulosus]EUB57157.1 hypothetical protein EGR_07974 [Echinococcus granulosus]
MGNAIQLDPGSSFSGGRPALVVTSQSVGFIANSISEFHHDSGGNSTLLPA